MRTITEAEILETLLHSGRPIGSYYLIENAPEIINFWSEENGPMTLRICDNDLAKAVKQYLSNAGLRTYRTLEEVCARAVEERWPGWEKWQ